MSKYSATQVCLLILLKTHTKSDFLITRLIRSRISKKKTYTVRNCCKEMWPFSFVVRHKLAPSKTKLSLFPTHRSDIDPTPARPTDLTDQPDRPDRPTRPTQMDERSTQTNGRRKRTVDTDERSTQTNGPHRRTVRLWGKSVQGG